MAWCGAVWLQFDGELQRKVIVVLYFIILLIVFQVFLCLHIIIKPRANVNSSNLNENVPLASINWRFNFHAIEKYLMSRKSWIKTPNKTFEQCTFMHKWMENERCRYARMVNESLAWSVIKNKETERARELDDSW